MTQVAWTGASKNQTKYVDKEMWGRYTYSGTGTFSGRNAGRLRFGGGPDNIRYAYGGRMPTEMMFTNYTQSSQNQGAYTGGTVKQTAWS